MKSFWNSMLAAFASYSIIPTSNRELTAESVKYQLCFLPLIGVVIGVLLYGWNVGWPYLCNCSFLPAVVFVNVPVIVSRGTHVDGFIDTVDAMCAPRTMEKKLEILKDTHTGSFAIIITLAYFLIALGVWSEMSINAVPMLAVGFVLSRALSGLAIVTFPHAKTSELLKTFLDEKQKRTVLIVMLAYIAVSVALMIYLQPLYGSIGVLGAIVSYVYYYYVSKKHFGGITNAVASFFIQICELIIPCMVLIAWKFI